MNLTKAEKCAAAENLINKGRFEDAEFLLDQVLESHPREPKALVCKSALLMKSGDLPKAKQVLRTAFEYDPQNPVVLTNLANLALLENRLDDAIECLKSAHAEQPDHLAAILLLAQIYQQSGSLREAAMWLNKATALAPGNANVLVAGAVFLLAQQKISEAKASFEKALELEPDNVRALTGLSQVQGLQGEFDHAGELAKKAHLLAPKDSEAAIALSRVYLSTGALAEAQKLMDRFKSRFADYAPVVLHRAEIAIARGQIGDTLAEAAKWLRKSPRDPARVTLFLKTLKMAGSWQQILDMCDKLPEDVLLSDSVQSLREEALQALGRRSEAWQAWAGRRKLSPESPGTPRRVVLPPRAPLLDELVLMRFADACARTGPVEVFGHSPIAGLWDRLVAAPSVRRAGAEKDLPGAEAELLADLAARTHLHASAGSKFEPYLVPDPERSGMWRKALPTGKGPCVGVFWQAQAPGLLIDHLMAAFKDLNVVPVSLQFDAARHQLRVWPEAFDAGVALDGIEDLVNLVNCLDLVVGPNGIPLHVAGALGRKGIAILKENHEWYWAGNGADSLWYPSIKRIVTPVGPTWEDAISALSEAIDISLLQKTV